MCRNREHVPVGGDLLVMIMGWKRNEDRRRGWLTIPMLCPRTCTRIWSLMVLGFVRKKKPRVMWKRDMEVMIVLDVMRAMIVEARCSGWM